MRNGRSRSRTGVHAAIAAIAMIAGLGAVGSAGATSAADDATVEGIVADTEWHPPEVTVQPGDTVTWTFEEGSFHNVRSSSSNWDFAPTGNNPATEPASYTFETAGRYDFVCSIHANTMTGTVIVGDGGTGDPDPDPDPSPSPSPSPQPGGEGSGTTPAPSPEPDTVKPTVRKVKLKAKRRAVRVRFRLSEPATVTIKVKRRGSKKVVKSARLQAPAGTSSRTLRSKRLKKGRYIVQIQARDAFGNRSSLARKRVRLHR